MRIKRGGPSPHRRAAPLRPLSTNTGFFSPSKRKPGSFLAHERPKNRVAAEWCIAAFGRTRSGYLVASCRVPVFGCVLILPYFVGFGLNSAQVR